MSGWPFCVSLSHWFNFCICLILLRGLPACASPKYGITEQRTGYKGSMKLTIRSFSANDVGTYHCVSTNSLGRAEGTLRLYGMCTRGPHYAAKLSGTSLIALSLLLLRKNFMIFHRAQLLKYFMMIFLCVFWSLPFLMPGFCCCPVHLCLFRNKNPPRQLRWLRSDEHHWRYGPFTFFQRKNFPRFYEFCFIDSAGLAERTRGVATTRAANGWLGVTIAGYYLFRALQLVCFERWCV